MLDALGPSGGYRSRNRTIVRDVAGVAVAELSLVPPLFVDRALAAQRRSEPMPKEERFAALVAAGLLFDTEVLAGWSAHEHHRLTSRVSGVPITAVRAASRRLADWTAELSLSLDAARPAGAVGEWRAAAPEGSALWARRGNVFGVNAAGNHPGLHLEWLYAMPLGYRVAIRPSRREPLTPHRLITALRAAGFSNQDAVLLPTEHAVAEHVIRGADLAMVYGGDEVVDKYTSRADVRAMGPGRSKILLGADVDWRDYIDMVVSSVAFEGGVGCVNASAVLVEGDPRPVAEAIAERLREIPSLPPEDGEARLPVQHVDDAQRLQSFVDAVSGSARRYLGSEGIVDPLGDGSAALRPAVYGLDAVGPEIGIELPFPCVWVAPWRRSDGLEPLRDTLVLSAATEDPSLIELLASEPTVRNLHLGATPTFYTRPQLPHDGFLTDFLMSSKGFVPADQAPQPKDTHEA